MFSIDSMNLFILQTQPSDGTRPPMDLFKAIFGDSSNSDSSDSEMEPDIALPTPVPTDAVVPPLPDAVGVAEPLAPTAASMTGIAQILLLFCINRVKSIYIYTVMELSFIM